MQWNSAQRAAVVFLLVLVSLATGCKRGQVEPDYGRQLPPGINALRKLPLSDWPDLATSYNTRGQGLLEAADRSLAWYQKPSTRQFFPSNNITHEQAHASVWRLRELLRQSTSFPAFEATVREEFDVYQSIGWDGQGTMLFTGYYSPIFTASAVRTTEYRYPLYKRPADLVTDPRTGEVLGRKVGDIIVRYPRRREIEESRMLQGSELVWMRDRFENYVVQVNGSARLRMTDGSIVHVGYAGNNGHEYVSVGKRLVADGKLSEKDLSLRAMRDWFQQNPNEADRYLNLNDRFVFFQPYNGDDWPAGSLGFKVTDMRTLATDKEVFPRGMMTIVATHSPAMPGSGRMERFMLDQDTGGAIRAAGRGDLYMGIGAEAEGLAGNQYAEGQLYYLVLKPQYVPGVVGRMGRADGVAMR